jgi:hypothetical protein
MGQFLEMIPKNILAFAAIVGGILFIVFVIQPPHTLCDSQVEVINKAQENFLAENARSKRLLSGKTDKALSTRYERLRDQCDATNDPGGCYELFQEMRTFLRDLNSLTAECSTALANSGPYGKALRETLERMVRIAWGSAPPASYTVKFGWLDASDINLFCRLKDRYVTFYGEDGANGWERFRENLMQSLPGAKDLPRNQIWDLSIFSTVCARYP